jgi:FCD domain
MDMAWLAVATRWVQRLISTCTRPSRWRVITMGWRPSSVVTKSPGCGTWLACPTNSQSARNPLLVTMFNQAQVARLSNVSPDHKSFYDPRHLAHHRALLRALKKRDGRAARAVVRTHLQSLGLMLEFVTGQGRRRRFCR